jgi:hypothetical protein
VHHAGSGRVLARWYEIKLNDWPASRELPTVAQQGVIDPGPTIRAFFPSIGVDAYGNAVITFARSSPNDFISMACAQRAWNDPPNTFQETQIVKAARLVHRSGALGRLLGDALRRTRLVLAEPRVRGQCQHVAHVGAAPDVPAALA